MAERYIPEHRRTQFKAKSTFKPEELRRRREEAQVEIRKAKREENLAKRRGIGSGENRPGASLGAAPDSDDENPPSESQVCDFLSIHFLQAGIKFAPGLHVGRRGSLGLPPPLGTPPSAVLTGTTSANLKHGIVPQHSAAEKIGRTHPVFSFRFILLLLLLPFCCARL
jgi:hypothetical protein